MTMLWGSLYGSGISMTHAAAGEARSAASDAQFNARQIAARLDRALLTCQAMWELMHDKLGITEEELVAKITEIDMRDGVMDGRSRPQATTCPQCNRAVAARFDKCMYCGTPVKKDMFA